jgi:hypothetical protein
VLSLYSDHVAFQICSLVDGEDFRAGPNLTPDQHIYRAANPAWIPQRPDRPRRRGRPPLPPQPPATISKFGVRRYLHDGRDYWSPYDLLGLFLSFMSPAPNGATKRNFYLPMTAVYGRWCRQIAGRRPGGGVGDLPYMFQCTWCMRSGQPTRFFLGSSLAGYSWDIDLTGTWETVLTRARFDLVDGVPLRQAGYDFDNSPMIQQSREAGSGPKIRFGTCAETYPFLDLLMYVLRFFLCRVHC